MSLCDIAMYSNQLIRLSMSILQFLRLIFSELLEYDSSGRKYILMTPAPPTPPPTSAEANTTCKRQSKYIPTEESTFMQ